MRSFQPISMLFLFIICMLLACKKETVKTESANKLKYTTIGAFTRISESITLSNGQRIFVGEDDGAAVLFVFDEHGSLAWQKRIDHPGRNVFTAVAEMDDGNIVVAGSTNSAYFNTKAQSADILIQCYGSSGNEIWTTVEGSEYDEFILDLLIDSKGNCMLTGSSNSNFWKTLAMKIRKDGRFLWRREYTFDAFSEGRGLIELDNGGYMIAGTSGNGVYKSPYVCFIYSNGNLQDEIYFPKYDRFTDRDRDDYSIDILPTDQGFLLCLFFLPTQRAYPSTQLIEITKTGAFVRVKELFGRGSMRPTAMRKDGSGYIICGASSSNKDYEVYGFREATSYLVRLDESLKISWQSGVGSSEIIQTAFDMKRVGNQISVGTFSQLQGKNSASILHYWLDESGTLIY